MCVCLLYFFFSCYGDHRDLHVLTHSFPTRRSSDLFADPTEACRNTHLVTTDVWTSMDFEAENEERRKAFTNWRSEEHTSELQSLMRISYAVFCLKKKNKITKI